MPRDVIQDCSLFKLPAELRLIIYKSNSIEGQAVDIHRELETDANGFSWVKASFAAFRRTCWASRYELDPDYYYAHNTFSLDIDTYAMHTGKHPWAMDPFILLTGWFEAIGRTACEWLEDVRLTFDASPYMTYDLTLLARVFCRGSEALPKADALTLRFVWPWLGVSSDGEGWTAGLAQDLIETGRVLRAQGLVTPSDEVIRAAMTIWCPNRGSLGWRRPPYGIFRWKDWGGKRRSQEVLRRNGLPWTKAKLQRVMRSRGWVQSVGGSYIRSVASDDE